MSDQDKKFSLKITVKGDKRESKKLEKEIVIAKTRRALHDPGVNEGDSDQISSTERIKERMHKLLQPSSSYPQPGSCPRQPDQDFEQQNRRYENASESFPKDQREKNLEILNLELEKIPKWELNARLQVNVTHFYSLSNFFVTPVEAVDFWTNISPLFRHLGRQVMVNPYGIIYDKRSHLMKRVKVTKFPNGSSNSDTIQCYFIDEGKSQYRKSHELHKIPGCLMNLMPTCFNVSLQKELVDKKRLENFVKKHCHPDQKRVFSVEIKQIDPKVSTVRLFLDNQPLEDILTSSRDVQTQSLEEDHSNSWTTVSTSSHCSAPPSEVSLGERLSIASSLFEMTLSAKPSKFSSRFPLSKDVYVKVRVTEVYSPSEFYLILDENLELFDEIQGYLATNQKCFKPLEKSEAMAATQCLYNNDSEISRAEILFVESDLSTIQLCETGRTIVDVPISKLLTMPADLSVLPPLAVAVKLPFVCTIAHDLEWNQHICDVFKTVLGFGEEVEDFFLCCKSISSVDEMNIANPIPVVIKDNEDTDVSQMLTQLLGDDVLDTANMTINPYKFGSLPKDKNETLTFQSIATDGLIDEVNLFRPSLLNSLEALIYDEKSTKLVPLESPQNGLRSIVRTKVGDESQLFRAMIFSQDPDCLNVTADLFDYETSLKLSRSSVTCSNFLCPDLEIVELFYLPADLSPKEIPSPVLRVRLQGLPDQLRASRTSDLLQSDQLQQLSDILQNKDGFNEFKVVSVTTHEKSLPVVKISSQLQPNLNEFYFSEIFKLSKSFPRQDPQLRRPRLNETENISIGAILKPFYQALEKSEECSAELASTEVKSDDVFWMIPTWRFGDRDQIHEKLCVLSKMLTKQKFRDLVSQTKPMAGQYYLVGHNVNVSSDSLLELFRVVVLFVENDRKSFVCHYFDTGKQVSVEIESTFIIPLPGTNSWREMLRHVPEKYRVELEHLQSLADFKPIAYPARLPQEFRDCTEPYLETIRSKPFVFSVCGIEEILSSRLTVNLIRE